LLFDSKYKTFKGKLITRWLGPYEVETIFDNGSVRIKTINDSQNSFVVNGHRLKVYNKPLSRDDFLQEISKQPKIKIVGEESSPPANP
jgi:hypothetical protein